jgi:hypothetical protein
VRTMEISRLMSIDKTSRTRLPAFPPRGQRESRLAIDITVKI